MIIFKRKATNIIYFVNFINMIKFIVNFVGFMYCVFINISEVHEIDCIIIALCVHFSYADIILNFFLKKKETKNLNSFIVTSKRLVLICIGQKEMAILCGIIWCFDNIVYNFIEMYENNKMENNHIKINCIIKKRCILNKIISYIEIVSMMTNSNFINYLIAYIAVLIFHKISDKTS